VNSVKLDVQMTTCTVRGGVCVPGGLRKGGGGRARGHSLKNESKEEDSAGITLGGRGRQLAEGDSEKPGGVGSPSKVNTSRRKQTKKSLRNFTRYIKKNTQKGGMKTNLHTFLEGKTQKGTRNT